MLLSAISGQFSLFQVTCTGQDEGGDSDAVFQIASGGTLKNVIIGTNQIEGVHCLGACTIQNVWWESVCEGKHQIWGKIHSTYA